MLPAWSYLGKFEQLSCLFLWAIVFPPQLMHYPYYMNIQCVQSIKHFWINKHLQHMRWCTKKSLSMVNNILPSLRIDKLARDALFSLVGPLRIVTMLPSNPIITDLPPPPENKGYEIMPGFIKACLGLELICDKVPNKHLIQVRQNIWVIEIFSPVCCSWDSSGRAYDESHQVYRPTGPTNRLAWVLAWSGHNLSKTGISWSMYTNKCFSYVLFMLNIQNITIVRKLGNPSKNT